MGAEDYTSDAIIEKRRFPRKPLNLIVHFHIISSKPSEEMHESTENISACGLALRCKQKLEKGEKIMITLYLPPKEKRNNDKKNLLYQEEECEKIKIFAHVIWNKSMFGGRFIHGVEFISVDLKDKKSIDEFLYDHSLNLPNIT